MSYKKINTKRDSSINIWLFIFMASLFLIIILPCVVKANQKKYVDKGNMFYVQVLNLTMPVVKVTSFNENDMAENTFSLKKMTLNMFGINPDNPISVLGKEISYLKSSDCNSFNEANESFIPYRLKEDDITKYAAEDDSNKISNIYNPKLRKDKMEEKPEVFIYHTHTTESYKPGAQDSFDETKNVCAVGDVIVNQLENNYNINVIHDKTVHNAYAYTKSYDRSGVTVDKYLKKYGDFKVVIDLHRDAVKNKNAVTTQINGENVAKIMFVMARKNPHFQKNMSMVNKFKEIGDRLYPEFIRGRICYYNYGTRFFNQNKSNGACLIEVGADINTTEEAKNSGKYLSRIIAEYLNGKN